MPMRDGGPEIRFGAVLRRGTAGASSSEDESWLRIEMAENKNGQIHLQIRM